MSKLDDIRKEYERAKEILFNNEPHFTLADVSMLLSKLEAAEKALKNIKRTSQILASHCAHRADSGGSLDAHDTFEKTQKIYEALEQALQQLRS